MKTINEDIDINLLVKKAKSSLAENGFFIAKDLIKREDYFAARKNCLQYFNELETCSEKLSHPLRGYVSAGMKDIIGFSRNKAWYLFRSCFFSWNRANNKMSKMISISKDISSIRNLIKGLPNDYGEYIEDDNSIAYTSLSNYPNDGGFLREHKDGKKSNILHFKVELTHKGVDYKKGGFYIFEKKENKKIDISNLIKPGDVAFFDGSQVHGIDPIFGDKGRVAFFQIPTKVNDSSRFGIYTNDGWSLLKRGAFRSQLLITPKLKKLINNFINLLP